MIEGTITVGDARLANLLSKIEDSVMPAIEDQEAVKAKFAQLQRPPSGVTPESFRKADVEIERITSEAIQAGLTTPGQDLYALPARRRDTGIA